ncbi:MAG: hypothetical protein NC489_46725 [Ruminococcus flavefaciens]|nr:hypothetical protein [Ruminococcus flavefaciens]
MDGAQNKKIYDIATPSVLSPKPASLIIQNHVNWCWATAAIIVGTEYCLRYGISPHFKNSAEGSIVVEKNLPGLRLQACGCFRDKITVNALQFEVVEHTKGSQENPNGYLPEGDDAKARALRYIITGDVYKPFPEIIVAGFYHDKRSLLVSSPSQIAEVMDLGNAFIGNFQKRNGLFHSIVLRPVADSKLELYDPWDGFTEQYSKEQVFQSGFLTNQGAGVVQWVQYVRPHMTNET